MTYPYTYINQRMLRSYKSLIFSLLYVFLLWKENIGIFMLPTVVLLRR